MWVSSVILNYSPFLRCFYFHSLLLIKQCLLPGFYLMQLHRNTSQTSLTSLNSLKSSSTLTLSLPVSDFSTLNNALMKSVTEMKAWYLRYTSFPYPPRFLNHYSHVYLLPFFLPSSSCSYHQSTGLWMQIHNLLPSICHIVYKIDTTKQEFFLWPHN